MTRTPTAQSAAATDSPPRPIVTATERPLDLWLVGAVLALLVIGTLEIYSASAPGATKSHGDGMFFLKRQLVWIAFGSLAMWAATRIDVGLLKRFTYPLLLCSIALLAGVLAFGQTINNATRWFAIGPISFQPVELCKLALISYLATSLGKKADRIKVFAVGFVPHLVVCALMTLLLLAQPDLGSSIVLAGTTLVILFVAGTRISYLALAILAAAPVGYH
ncbi:MAG TPA: FtsW/RodA/SpoVE family cell cycle protein, partial [Kofleriaceae bacterium]|nr:FtsW/RodA/SpoVE family cell cycle protein [Kofleriaceae bacterium]